MPEAYSVLPPTPHPEFVRRFTEALTALWLTYAYNFAGSLMLLYHYCVLALARESWNTVLISPTQGDIADAHRACLDAAVTLVDFVEQMKDPDFQGYWSSRTLIL